MESRGTQAVTRSTAAALRSAVVDNALDEEDFEGIPAA
jgi:hypothetical protein